MKTFNSYKISFLAALTFLFFSTYLNRSTNGAAETESTEVRSEVLPQIIRPVQLNKVYEFAGESIPQNFDAYERLDREMLVNSYWHSSTVMILKSANRFFPVIETILKEQGIPDDFKYLAVTESALRNATSSAGAQGIWQFMKNTGKYYGLEINEEVDERYHLEKSTIAACKYVNDYHAQFENWSLSAVAYNMGGPNLKRLLKEQREESYFDININQESMRYLFRILAFKEIMQDPSRFGFYLHESDKYEPLDDYKTVEVDHSIANLGDFAHENGVTYRMLKLYNPWLRKHTLTNKAKKTYYIKIPNS